MPYDVTMLFTYFVSFICYEDDIFEAISNLQVQESKFVEKFDGEKN